ncbi:PD-(D/E)XK nuclease superfamily protein [Loktanella atrilutea]|uniref:PD-(D/E)XK nuclease superfamily protein n=1 Tax=Loktanella atrilutea TaxID=366533 RepID=A0A1M5FKY9_LOKAT|nr:PD-(D/E)XK nuclease family protein [Loktanella atrilutea]SHF92166.1 PD-(D/E)XK nuclease superfamily protein [Loktanella atrilutea]
MMSDEFIPTLSHATERDVDLLLVEELFSSLDFTSWMARSVGITTPIVRWDVKHSKRRTRSRREIDIFVEMQHVDGARSAILIENKLDATEQPDQAESYRDELHALASDYRMAAMIIVCPEAYAAKHSEFTGKFDATVSYESLCGFFREMETVAGSDLVLRHRFRGDILEQAIHKYRRGYTAIPDSTVGDFNARYVILMAKLAPEILPGPSMLKPANPRESTSMIFNEKASFQTLTQDIRPRRFAHELGRGSNRRANYVAVTFGGWGFALNEIRDRLEHDSLELGAEFSADKPTKVRPNPGLKLSIATEPIDNQGSFEDQVEAIEDGIAVARELRRWLCDNQTTLLQWREIVDDARIISSPNT